MKQYPSVFDLIAEEFAKANISHLLIGDVAADYYAQGYVTADIDLLIVESHFERASNILKTAGYKKANRSAAFLHFLSDKHYLWDVRLIFTDDEFLKQIMKRGKSLKIGNQNFRIPCLENLSKIQIPKLPSPKTLGMDDYLRFVEMCLKLYPHQRNRKRETQKFAYSRFTLKD